MTMVPYIGNVVLVSDDKIAIGAIAAKMMSLIL
jgi:hypothetical protein